MFETSPGKSLKIRVRIPDAAQPASVAEPELRSVRPAVWVIAIVGMCTGIAAGLWPTPATEPESEIFVPEVAAPEVADAAPAVMPVEAPASTPAPPANSRNRVLRALITDSMRGQTPGAELAAEIPAAPATRRFYFFTEVEQPEGKRFAHLWQHEGKTTARINFRPRNSPWRAGSNKRIPSHLQGRWRAVLVDEHDNELASAGFVYGEVKQ